MSVAEYDSVIWGFGELSYQVALTFYPFNCSVGDDVVVVVVVESRGSRVCSSIRDTFKVVGGER